MRRTHPALFLLTAGLVIFACMVVDELITSWDGEREGGEDSDEDGEPDPVAVPDTIAQAGRFGTLHVALKTAGLVEALEAEGPFTVFAPTDAAFARLGERLDELLADPETLARILKHHVVSGSYPSTALSEPMELTTLADTTIAVEPGTPPHVGGSGVVEPNLTATNGVVHGIDEVLTPPDVPKRRRKKKSTGEDADAD